MRYTTFSKLERPRAAIALLIAIVTSATPNLSASFLTYPLSASAADPPDWRATYSLVAPAEAQTVPVTNSQAAQALVARGYFTDAAYAQWRDQLLFEQAYSALDARSLMTLLIDQGVLREGITSPDHVIERLRVKGIDVAGLHLRPDGLLTAIGDIRGEGSLYVPNTTGTAGEIGAADLLMARTVKEGLRVSFNADRATFLAVLPREAFLKLLGATDTTTVPTRDPIEVHAWNPFPPPPGVDPVSTLPRTKTPGPWRPLNENSTGEAYAYNPVGLSYDTTKGYWVVPFYQVPACRDILTSPRTADKEVRCMAKLLRQLPEGQRFIRLPQIGFHFSDLPQNFLSPLKNAQNHVVSEALCQAEEEGTTGFTAVPCGFPDLTDWTAKARARLEPVAQALRAQQSASEAPLLDGLILDHEDTSMGAFNFFPLFQRTLPNSTQAAFELLFQDPRLADLLADISMTEAEFRLLRVYAQPSCSGLTAAQCYEARRAWQAAVLTWDHHFWIEREKALSDGIISVFKNQFPALASSNFRSRIATDSVPANLFYRFFYAWGLGAWLQNPGALPSQPLYGDQVPITIPGGTPSTTFDSTPPAPSSPACAECINATRYWTVFNALATNLNEAHQTSAASAVRNRHWVTHPSIQANAFGPNARYDETTRVNRWSGGTDMGNAMAELWYRAAADAEVLQYYVDDTNYPTAEGEIANFGNDTLVELNELLGFSDRRPLYEGVVEVNGQTVPVGPVPVNLERDTVVWGARANGKNVYRVVLDIEPTSYREALLRNNGTNGQPVEIVVPRREGEGSACTVASPPAYCVGDEVIKIPHAKIVRPATEVSKMGFWVVQDDPQADKPLQADLATVLDELSRPVALPPVITVTQESYTVAPGQLITIPFTVACSAPPCTVIPLGIEGGTVTQSENPLPLTGSDRDVIEIGP